MKLDALMKTGWTETPPTHKAAARALTYRQKGKNHLVLEERKKELWLWIEASRDRRVLSLVPGKKLGPLLQALDEIRDGLSVDTHLTHYLSLSEICPASIVAWEQFET